MAGLMLPGAARTVTLTENGSSLHGSTVRRAVPAWPAKDPGDAMDVAADFAALTNGIPLDGIAYAAQGCGVAASAVVGTVAVLQVTGGVDKVPGMVRITAAFDAGETRSAVVCLPILAQGFPGAASVPPAPPAMPANAMRVAGVAITVAGQPILI